MKEMNSSFVIQLHIVKPFINIKGLYVETKDDCIVGLG